MRHESYRSRLSTFKCIGVAGMICLLVGCSKEAGQSEADAVIHAYSVRGRIVQLPDSTNPASELRIHHEAIDEFKLTDGSPGPMHAMTMPFPPAKGVSLEGFAIGDVVEFGFEVQWEPSPGMSLTTLKKLPADTPLGFDGPASSQPDQGHAEEHH